MKNNIVMGQFIIEKHGKREENACFGDNAALLCPECFSSKVMAYGGKQKYILKNGFLFQKVCSCRDVSCLKCECEFLQLGNDVRKEKVSDFCERIKMIFIMFFLILMFVSIILTVVFAILEKETPSMVFLFIFILSMCINSAICS